MLVPLFLRERHGEKIAPWTSGTSSPETQKLQLNSWVSIFRSLYSVFSLKNSILLAFILFIAQGAYNYIETLLPIFTVKALNWTNGSYSQFFSTAKIIGGIGGMLIGGILIDKFGKKRMMNIYFLSMIFFTGVLAFSKTYWGSTSFIYAFMTLYNIVYTFACIGIFAIAMQCCWKKVSASQFTLYMTIGNLGRIALAALIGPVKANFNWQVALMAFAVMIALAWLIMQFLNINKQLERVVDLENKDNQSDMLQVIQ
jgi:PAT family beta-lactamase induction signal transducer AmpG